MKLLGSTKNKIAKDENGENVPHLEITGVVLVHCSIVNNDNEHDLRVLHTFASTKSSGQSLDILPTNFIFLGTFNSEFSYIEVWFTDKTSKPPEIKEKKKITLVVNWSVKYKNVFKPSKLSNATLFN